MNQLPMNPGNDMTDVRIKSGLFGGMGGIGRQMGRVMYRTGQFLGVMPWETPRRSQIGVDPIGEEFMLNEDQQAKARLMGQKIYHEFVAGRFSFLSNDDGKSNETPQMREEYWKFAVTEPALDAALWTKITAVIANELIIKPSSKSGFDRYIADWVHDCIIRCKGGLRNIGEQILFHGQVYGNVLCEPKWKHEHRQVHSTMFPYGFWTLKDFVAKPPGDYKLEIDGFRNITGVWSAKTAEWFDPTYFVYWAHKPIYGNMGGTSGVRSVRRACTLLKLAHNYRGIYLEQFGLPMIKATYPQNDDDSQRIARAAIQHARSLGYILIPEGVDVEALTLAQRGESDYQDAIDDYRKEIFLGQTGSYLYAMEGSVGHAAGNSETHRSTLDLWVGYLSKILEEILNDQIIPWLITLNIYNADPPRAMIGGVNDEDLKASLEVDDKLISWGVELDEDELRDRYHRSAPKNGKGIGGMNRLMLGMNNGMGANNVQGNPFAGQAASFPLQNQGQAANNNTPPQRDDQTVKFSADDEDFTQQQNYTCGTASLRFAMNHFGVTPPEESVLSLLLGTTPAQGTNAASIVRLAKQNGLEAEGQSNMTMLEMSERLKDGAVVLAPIQKFGSPEEKAKNQTGHWIAVTRLDGSSGMLEYFDPVLGSDKPCWESLQTFAANWHDRDGDGKMLPRYAITISEPKKKMTFSTDDLQLGYISIPLPEFAEAIQKVQSAIDPADLIKTENDHHITLLYGCGADSFDDSVKLCASIAPIKMTFGGTFTLSPKDADHDVLAFKVYGDALEKANYSLASGLEVKQDYDTFQPHVKIGRLKQGAGSKYTSPSFAGFSALLGDSKVAESAQFKVKGGEALSLPFAAVSDLPVLKFSEEPASDEVAKPGKDGDKADKLLQNVKEDGTAILARLCKMAYRRMLDNGVGGSQLFTMQERNELTEAFLGCVINANLLGRSSTISKFLRDQDESRVDRFADETPFDAFSSALDPLRPELAIDYFKNLFPMIGVDPVAYIPQMRRYAFTLAVATETTLLGKVHDLLTDALHEGTLDTQFKIDDLLKKTGVAPENPQYSEMVFRTNMMDAYTTGTTDQAKDPTIAEAYPVWRYDGIDDERAGKDHRPKFGKYYPSSAEFADVRGDRPYNCVLPGQMTQGRINGALKAHYSGEAVEIYSDSGDIISLTVNHPVLTDRGFIRAGEVKEGDYLVSYSGEHQIPVLGEDYQYFPTLIEDVFETISVVKGRSARASAPVSLFKLYGDELFLESKIDVVGSYRELLFNGVPHDSERVRNSILSGATVKLHGIPRSSTLQFNSHAVSHPSSSGVGLSDLLGSDAFAHQTPFSLFCFGSASHLYSQFDELLSKTTSVDVQFVGKSLHGGTGKVAFSKARKIRNFHYDGPVFDCSTDVGYFIVNNIFISNCRCCPTMIYKTTWQQLQDQGKSVETSW